MGNTQYAILFKQRPLALPSMIFFCFMTKIILYVQNMEFFNKKPLGAKILRSRKGGHWQRGGGGG